MKHTTQTRRQHLEDLKLLILKPQDNSPLPDSQKGEEEKVEIVFFSEYFQQTLMNLRKYLSKILLLCTWCIETAHSGKQFGEITAEIPWSSAHNARIPQTEGAPTGTRAVTDSTINPQCCVYSTITHKGNGEKESNYLNVTISFTVFTIFDQINAAQETFKNIKASHQSHWRF